MSNFTDFISGGGGSASFPTIFLHTSQTWVPPQDGNIMIHVIGAGGSGAAGTSTPFQSGAAGGYCRKNSLAVTTAGSYTVTIGAGGASRIASAGAGTAGGTTSVSGTGLGSTLTATGGAGGAVSSVAFNTGGVGSNGDVNNTGGRGGNLIGGGAVGLAGTGNDGGILSSVYYSYGGDCDILGDFYSSSFGQLSGSQGGVTNFANDSQSGNPNAGPLAGAGCTAKSNQIVMSQINASIGGGGGWCFGTTAANFVSGRGGEGCVVIQYIP